MIVWAIATALLAPATSNDLVAARLEVACKDANSSSQEMCSAYLLAGARSLRDAKGSFRRICPPATAGIAAYQKVFSQYLLKHPDEAQRPAVIVILKAFEQAYSCPS